MNLKAKQQVYKKLIDAKSISECISKNWRYNRKIWYAATYVYTEVQLIKKWLEDENGILYPGSLENIVHRQGLSVTTNGVHCFEGSALNECAQRRRLQEAGAVSGDEVIAAIDRFLKN
ncbi:MAG: hypothetical protein NDI69_17890 [Bacteriovoracaceae bacterium]|nr:hypothetical protein [Bacteriovoracaceae bacterium]